MNYKKELLRRLWVYTTWGAWTLRDGNPTLQGPVCSRCGIEDGAALDGSF